ncbi:PspC domain-containing protein [Paenibacillus sp. GCM10023252]|uniref:PspC domain-containing protein n=1 Tax=Paenibacillus sp. GCM10023252 TaxID=3252649 RepID=UPI00360D4D51
MRKLYRSTRDKKLFGLCGGLSQMLNVDATLLRILLVVAAVFTSGTVIVIYIIAGFVVPKEPSYPGFGPGPGGYGTTSYGPGPGGYGHHTAGFGEGAHGGPYKNPPQGNWTNSYGGGQSQPESPSTFDSMMDDLEKKALRKEIEELRSKLARYEKGDL